MINVTLVRLGEKKDAEHAPSPFAKVNLNGGFKGEAPSLPVVGQRFMVTNPERSANYWNGSPPCEGDTWVTSMVVSVEPEKDGVVNFTTQNTHYRLVLQDHLN